MNAPIFPGALEKLRLGQFIMIREGTAAHNPARAAPADRSPAHGSLHVLLRRQASGRARFRRAHRRYHSLSHCDGRGPDCRREGGHAFRSALFPDEQQGSDCAGLSGRFRGDRRFPLLRIQKVFKRGSLVYDGTLAPFPDPEIPLPLAQAARDTIHIAPVSPETFASARPLPVIGMISGELLSRDLGFAEAMDASHDLLKIALVERHHATGMWGLRIWPAMV